MTCPGGQHQRARHPTVNVTTIGEVAEKALPGAGLIGVIAEQLLSLMEPDLTRRMWRDCTRREGGVHSRFLVPICLSNVTCLRGIQLKEW